MTEASQPVLEFRNLKVTYHLEKETVAAVNGVDLSLQRGHTLGLVGETGAGKTSTALSSPFFIGANIVLNVIIIVIFACVVNRMIKLHLDDRGNK